MRQRGATSRWAGAQARAASGADAAANVTSSRRMELRTHTVLDQVERALYELEDEVLRLPRGTQFSAAIGSTAAAVVTAPYTDPRDRPVPVHVGRHIVAFHEMAG